MKVLGLEVDDSLVAKWGEWYAPPVQPFFVASTKGFPRSIGGAFTTETADTFKTWSPKNKGKRVIWLDEERARNAGLPFHAPEDALAFVEAEGLQHRRPHPLAGFPAGSGPNCFGAVMSAAGTPSARVLDKPFDRWLRVHARPGGRDEDAGTLLVWRDTSEGRPFHAAITIGDGYAFEKPSQCWWSPRYVASVDDIKRVTRMRGIRLERWRLNSQL